MLGTADFEKHRLASVDFSSEFEDVLASGDALASVSQITISKWNGTQWEDKSSEFGSPSGNISGTTVQYTLGAAGSGDQDGGLYQILVVVDTTDGESLWDLITLDVLETGDPNAP